MPSAAIARHCQICGRAIKTVLGYPVEAVDGRGSRAFQTGETIAHHGYERPGDGWQTSSCFGARWRPYELACDAIPVLVAVLERKIDTLTHVINDWRISPPETLVEERTRQGREPITHNRPDGYDAIKATETGGSYIPHSYDAEFKKAQWGRLRGIKSAKQSIEFLQKRMADWPSRHQRAA